MVQDVPRRSWPLICRGRTLIWKGLDPQIPMVLRDQGLFGAAASGYKILHITVRLGEALLTIPSHTFQATVTVQARFQKARRRPPLRPTTRVSWDGKRRPRSGCILEYYKLCNDARKKTLISSSRASDATHLCAQRGASDGSRRSPR